MNFEKLNDVSCRIDDIQNNDKILIGGSYPGTFNLAVTADIDNFEALFQKTEENARRIETNSEMKQWLDKAAPGFDLKTFAHLYAFDNVLRKMYPGLSDNTDQRAKFYDEKGSKTLSESVAAGICACAEIALLAQAYLQRQGFDSKYCGGELLHHSSDEDGEPHSFISMKIPGGDYFYDPANPTPNAGAHLPKILSIEATPAQKRQFENKIHANDGKRNCAFLEARDILTKASSYYGYGDGMTVFPSFIISQNKCPNLPAKEMSL